MNVIAELKSRFRAALAGLVDDPTELLEQIRRSQDPTFGDYQANLAMPLAKRLGRPPRDVAQEIINRLDVADLCQPPEIAGPGFINLRLRDEWLSRGLTAALSDPRLGVEAVKQPRTFIVDYSGPNVAKPMHVGHIRSTVIGDSLTRTLRFLGHRVTSDNHLGDWGTQFGMILYGYQHFRDEAAFKSDPVRESGRLYKLVRQLMDCHEGLAKLPTLRQQIAKQEEAAKRQAAEPVAPVDKKKADKTARQLQKTLAESREELTDLEAKLAAVDRDPALSKLAAEHSRIGQAVLNETALLHEGDPDRLRLWKQFLPPSLVEIERIYQRLDIRFDVTLGESFYHDRLAGVVEDLKRRGLARDSEGAVAVFLPNFDTPMLIQKQDGAYLYGTTDLATIQYRMEKWRPDAILYVVDHRQSLHFEQLFAAARLWGISDVEMQHVSFGTVLGEDGRPFRTRAGDTVGLEGLLDEAVRQAHEVVSRNDDEKKNGPELSPDERSRIAEVVGIAAIKYADLAQNRTSDYVFSIQKMVAMTGNTATYMQYAHARVCSIFAKGNVSPESLLAELQQSGQGIELVEPSERALGLELANFSEALSLATADYRPNHLTSYLFELANRFSTFYDACPVLKAATPRQRASRLLLCHQTARTLRQGLELLGIKVVEKM